MATQTGTEWLRALVESAEPIEPGNWADEPPSPEVWADTIDRAQVAALGEVADLPPAIATCAECGATTPARWSSEVYPDGGPTDAPFLVIDGPGTGWRAWADRYWCAAHADAPARYALNEAAWMSRRGVAIAEWERANPRPAVSNPTPGE